jgi:hypothetical protein
MKLNEDKNPKSRKKKLNAVGPGGTGEQGFTAEEWKFGWMLSDKVELAKKQGLIRVQPGENPLRAELRYILDLMWRVFPQWRWN